jgi:two-component system nitrogen regulation sensor histidine kinase NtrY
MIYRSLYFNIIVRVLLLTLTCLVFAFIYVTRRDVLIQLNILLLLALQVYFIIYKLNKINRDLTGFFDALRNDDSSIIYQKMAPDKRFSILYKCFDDINNRLRKLKIDSINKNLYLQNLVDHVGIGVISFDNDDNIEIFNNAAKNLVRINRASKLKNLEKADKNLPSLLKELKPGEQKLIKIKTEDELLQLATKASVFKVEGKTIKLISLQNIKNELEEKELESWQQLIRILTHEIMNSISPISSSIKTIKELLTHGKEKSKPIEIIEQELIDDSVKGLNIIEERSDGLVDFVEKFRSLTLLSKPVFKQFQVQELFENLIMLMSKELSKNNIHLEIAVIPETLNLTADKKLVEQIMINLINNSIQAYDGTGNKEIKLKAFSFPGDKTIIQVIDNGKGIQEDNIDRIFIPFFTTKEMGSGIGLSLSRQIMRLHNGQIKVKSIPDKETVFSLEF